MITSMSSLPQIVLRSKNAGASHRGEGGVPEEGRPLHAGTFEDWKVSPDLSHPFDDISIVQWVGEPD